MSKLTRSFAAVVTVVVAVAVVLFGATAVLAKNKGKKDSGTAYVAITHTAGGLEYAAGSNQDKVLGKGAVTYILKVGATANGVTITSKHVTLYTGTGSLSGTGSAKVTVVGNTETLTGGKLDLKKGKGSQKGHSLVATFTGTGNTTTSQFVFHYKGTYK